MPDTPLMTACIVTYNSQEHIRNVLTSLKMSTIGSRMNIIVVDNASQDDTAGIVESEFPDVRLIKLTENIGFGKAHNKALPYMNAPYHVIVNPDITLQPDVLEQMADFMDSRPDVSLLSPKVLHPDGKEQFLPKELPSVHYLMGGFFETFGKPFTTWRGRYTWREKGIAEPTEACNATGCFMFTRASALKAVNGFDNRYFLYFEDADLTREMKKQGIVLYHPGFAVTHVWARESARKFKSTMMLIRSMTQYFHKWGWKI